MVASSAPHVKEYCLSNDQTGVPSAAMDVIVHTQRGSSIGGVEMVCA